MRKVINEREKTPAPEVIQGFKELLKVYSPSCVVADAQERAGVMRSFITSVPFRYPMPMPRSKVRVIDTKKLDPFKTSQANTTALKLMALPTDRSI